jgi:BMFP domain-containing protein YqiC
VLLASAAFGVTPSEYRNDIDAAKSSIDILIRYLDNGSGPREAELVSDVRDRLPVSQRIEWQGSSVESANQWLNARLDAFRSEPDFDKRRQVLIEIGERLSSISATVRSLETQSTDRQSKDEDKTKLSEILVREEYQKTEVAEEGFAARMLRRFLEWLRGVFPSFNPPNLEPGRMQSATVVLQVLLYILIAGLLMFGLYKFAPSIFPNLRRNRKTKEGSRTILGEMIAPDESGEDIFSVAERLAREGDVRGAIRKGYMALLCELNDRRQIKLVRHKTNRDYIRELRGKRDLQTGLGSVTGVFERFWYGIESPAANDWDQFRAEYHAAIRHIQQ